MHFFEHMKDIYFDSYEQFVEQVDVHREQMLRSDRALIESVPKKLDLDEESSSLPNGRFETVVKNVNFKCFFYHKPNMPLYVFLNGAKVGKEMHQARWSYYSFLNGSLLNIIDPMMDLYSNLRLGWYYGNAEVNFREILAELVLKIAKKLNIKGSDVIFVGSSGGGATIIECASYIKGSKAVSINPQIVLAEHGYASEFMNITGNDLKEDAKWHRHNAIHYLQNIHDTTYILIVNMRSYLDMKQLENICKAKKIRVKYGLNVFDNLIIWIYDGNMGKHLHPHNVQEYPHIWFMIENLLRNIDNKKYLEENEALYCITNEFWNEHWTQERKWRDRIGGVINGLSIIHKKKETAIFGIGYVATKLAKEILDISGENHFNIQYALDNNLQKRNEEFQGLPIKHPSDISNWNELYIIITTERYDKEIGAQLEKFGLFYGKDYMFYKDLYSFP